jgi:reductive dehalogenase
MTFFLTIANGFILIVTSVFLLGLCLSSLMEKEIRAAIISLFFFAVNTLVWGAFLTILEPFQVLNIFFVSLLAFFCLISSIKFFPGKSSPQDLSKAEQYDERNNMFARNNLQHHPQLLEKYYDLHPENRSTDLQIHQKPEFGQKEQVYHDPYTAPCYGAAFEYLERSIPLSTGAIAEQKKPLDPILFSKTITDFAKFYGACDVAFLGLKPHHFYSHKGRHAATWGDKTNQTHKTAITIVVPMRVEMIKKGPTSSVLQESAQKYVEAAKISNILATYIRYFGYEARAHNDANYDVLCVPIAVESGLGELGRMGLFMHRVHGPCVRLAVVTTGLELPDSLIPQPLYMENFCQICKKCADNCPSGSISHGDEPHSRNFRHWSIHQEKCFSYWKTIGSDCGFCIGVCPYTKPDNPVHRLVRFYISRNALNQKIALFMDDLLYGRYKKIARTNPEKIL